MHVSRPIFQLPSNTGYWLQKPFESPYSTLRRFVISNPGRTYADHLKTVRKGRDLNKKSTINILLENIEKYESQLPNPQPKTALIEEFGPQKHCPMCADICFHNQLFTHASIIKCPIHQCNLLLTCPTCKKPWPSKRELFERDCGTCGNSLRKEMRIEASRRVSGPKFNKFKEFERLWCSMQPKGKAKIQFWVSMYAKPRVKLLEESDQYWLSCQHAIRNISYPPYIKTSSFKQKSVKLRAIRTFNQDQCNRVETWHLRAQLRCIYIVTKFLYSKMVHKHKLRFIDFETDHSVYANTLLEACPYCLIFSIWFEIITHYGSASYIYPLYKNIYDPFDLIKFLKYHPPLICGIVFNGVAGSFLSTGDKNVWLGVPNESTRIWLATKLMLLVFRDVYNGIALCHYHNNYMEKHSSSSEDAISALAGKKKVAASTVEYQHYITSEKRFIRFAWVSQELKMLSMPMPIKSVLRERFQHHTPQNRLKLNTLLEPIYHDCFLKNFEKLIKRRTSLVGNFDIYRSLALIFDLTRFNYRNQPSSKTDEILQLLGITITDIYPFSDNKNLSSKEMKSIFHGLS